MNCLVDTLERRHRLALGLIERRSNNLPVPELNLTLRLLLPRQGVFHPVLIITLGVILTRVGTTRLLSRGGGRRRLRRTRQQVTQLQRLHKIRVPDHAAILDSNIGVGLIDLADFLHTFIERLLGAEDRDIGLHSLLHGEADLVARLGAVGVADLIELRDGLGANIGGDGLVRGAGGEGIADGMGHGATKDDEIEEGVGAEAVGTVDGDAGGFTGGEEAGNGFLVALLVDSEDLSGVAGGDTAHVVVDGGEDGDGGFGNVDTGEDGGGFRDTGETLVEDLGGEVGELEVEVVLVGADTAALADLDGHGAGDDVAGGEVLGGGRVALHEALTFGVDEVSAFAAGALGDEAAGAVDTGGVELDEFEILVGETGASDHGHSVTSTGVRGGAREVGTSVSTGGKDGLVGAEAVEGTVFLVVGEDTDTLAVLHEEIEGEVLNEVVGVVAERLAVESVEEGMSGTVSGGAASVCLTTLSEILRLTTESTLVDLSILRSRLLPSLAAVQLHRQRSNSRRGNRSSPTHKPTQELPSSCNE